uniref:glycosyltransferase family 2 protein n=1 Tax=Prevotella sp. TaxID=59823 RepID=UPI0040299F99
MTPLVLTVIIPVYKTVATLDRCVESVLSQADGCEIILVDDGSPDSCGDLCDRWAGRSDRISVVHQPNRGLSAARNSGIARSHAPYVTFVDSDDVLHPHTLPPLLALLAAHPDYD